MRIGLAVMFMIGVFNACQNTPEGEQVVERSAVDTVPVDTMPPPPPPPPPIEYTVDTFLNDYASLVSGLPSTKYFAHFYSDSSYMRLERRSGREWSYMLDKKINHMRAWSDTVISPHSANTAIFYPFAGADFLHVEPLFSNVDRFVMVGLEPLGTVIADTGNKRVLKSHADKIYASLYFSNRLGFFRTLSMRAELNQQELNGALPLLLFYIRRYGYTIASLEYFNLDSAGQMIVTDPDKAIALKLKFHNFEGKIHELDYFRFDLSDSGLDRDNRLIRYVENIEPYGVYLKAASYLMFSSSFNTIRSTILTNAKYVLQDDSGIPLSYFGEGSWARQLWGKYTRTISLFRGRFQQDLADSYATGDSLPLNFYIGYNISHRECNMMWFVKKDTSVNATDSTIAM